MAGPSFVLPPPFLQPRRLLDIIEQLPKMDDDGGNPLRWLEGVTWPPFICKQLHVDNEALCTYSGDGLNDTIVTAETCATWSTQTPFRLIDAFQAFTLEYSFAEAEAMLAASYGRLTSAAFARELLGGGSGSTSLSDVATAPAELAFGAAAKIDRVLAALESEIALRMQGSVGYIHIPPGLLAEAVSFYGLQLVNNHWETPAGNIVISDAGYYEPPAPSGGGSSAADGEDWVYASGPVFFEATAPLFVGVGSETFVGKTGGLHDTTPWNRNVFEQFVAGYGILVFDSCPVTAALATYTL
jgi:hypothetical protein